MVIVCRRCDRRGQIPMPAIGSTLRCSACGQRQRFGDGQTSTRVDVVNAGRGLQRQRREIAGVVRFDRRAPAANVQRVEQVHFDDPISDLFKAG